MDVKKSFKLITRLPIKITVEKEDLDSDDDITASAITPQNKPNHNKSRTKLSSTIKTGMEPVSLYIDVNPQRQKPQAEKNTDNNQHGSKLQDVAAGSSQVDKMIKEKSVLKPGFEKLEAVPAYSQSVRKMKMERRKEASKTKGDKWFNLPATEMTEEKLRDLEVIQMRSILNPKQFYKKNDLKVLPKYFQVGTVVDNAADFYHNRVPRKDRKKTLVDELMQDANFQRYNKRKYADIIQAKPKISSGAQSKSRRMKKKK